MPNAVRTFLFSLLLLCTVPCLKAQTFYRTTTKDVVLAVRGKVIGFFIIEDTFFATGTIGLETIVNRRHCFGVDATWFRWRYETDDDKDNAMYEQYEKRRYLLFDYKLRFISVDKGYFYLNVYDKNGRYDMWYKPWAVDFGTQDTSFIRSNTHGTFNEPGLGIGFKWFFNYEGCGWGLDISANAARRFSVDDIAECNNHVLDIHPDVHDDRYGVYMRANFFFQFGDSEETEDLFRNGKYR